MLQVCLPPLYFDSAQVRFDVMKIQAKKGLYEALTLSLLGVCYHTRCQSIILRKKGLIDH